MRISVYTALNRLATPSGVPRHIREIVGGLLRDPSLNVTFFVNREQANRYFPEEEAHWGAAPRVTFDASVGLMQRRWGLLNRPTFEALGGDADWLYLPADSYVPTQRAQLAVTIHDVYKLESPAPGERFFDHYYGRLRHRVLYRRIAQYADKVLTVSRFSAERIQHYLGVPEERIGVIYNGVSDAFFHPDNALWPALSKEYSLESKNYFVYAGGLKPKKNADGLIQAWKRFEETHPNYRLMIFGHHHGAALSQAQALLKHAVFGRRVRDPELATLLSNARALFFPSFYEGFGIPVAEAMAAGTSLVLSDIPAFRELAGDFAYFGDPHDPRSLTEALEAAATQSDSPRNAAINAGRQYAKQYTWDQCVQRVLGTLS